jgi:hypothetical protein
MPDDTAAQKNKGILNDPASINLHALMEPIHSPIGQQYFCLSPLSAEAPAARLDPVFSP